MLGTRAGLYAIVAAGALAAGCGSGSKSGSASKGTASPAPPPASLVGSWSVTLKRTDVGANKAPELENLAWTMKVTKSGGVGDAPTLTISTADGDQLETSTLSVSGDHLTLSREECASASGGYSVVTSAYRWKIVAGRLSMTPVKTGCPDKVASTILGSRRWKRGS